MEMQLFQFNKMLTVNREKIEYAYIGNKFPGKIHDYYSTIEQSIEMVAHFHGNIKASSLYIHMYDAKQRSKSCSNEFSYGIYVNIKGIFIGCFPYTAIRLIQFQRVCVELTTTVQLFWRLTFDKAVIYVLIFMMDKCDKPGKSAGLKLNSFSHYFFMCIFM